MSDEQPVRNLKRHQSINKILTPGKVSSLLIALCWFVIFTGTAQGSAKTTFPSLVTQIVTPSPVLTKTAIPIARPTPLVIVVNTPAATQSNPQDNLFILILITLLSGSIGAIFGSVIGARINNKGLMRATKQQTKSLFEATERQINSLYEQETENRKYAEQRQHEVIRLALLAEIKENIDFLTQDRIIPLLGNEAWTLYKGNIAFLPVSLQEELIKGYAEIKRCNAYFEMNMAPGNTPEGRVILGHSIEPQKKIVLDICHSLFDQLSHE